jgi:putative transposase
MMIANDPYGGRNDYLKRLPPEHYRGRAYVHWSMTIQDRRTGWLVPIFFYKFREILTHTAFRFGLCCPIYCCMPDHLHLLVVGIMNGSDQRLATRYLRKQLNPILSHFGVEFQGQGHDHVLSENEREPAGFEEVFAYIARNPERAGLVRENGFRDYPYTGCLIPGYPEVKIWDKDYDEKLWRIYAHLVKHGLFHSWKDE